MHVRYVGQHLTQGWHPFNFAIKILDGYSPAFHGPVASEIPPSSMCLSLSPIPSGDTDGGRMVRLGLGSKTLVLWAPVTTEDSGAAGAGGGSGSK